VKRLLDQADLPVRPAEALFVYLVGVVVGGALGLLIGNAIWGLIALGIVGAVPWVALVSVARRRTATFTAQLPDMLQLLGTTLRSGFSILQGLDTVAQQLSDPIGKEMRHVVAEARLGRPLVDALTEVAQRVHSDDFQWVVTAIGIQREVGGNLAELLDIVAETMTARARIRQEARTLTAEGRIGAIVISVLPIFIGLFVYSVNPTYISPLFHEALGEILFYGSIVLGLIGIYWVRKLVDIEV
jgi:tight adherence protein B